MQSVSEKHLQGMYVWAIKDKFSMLCNDWPGFLFTRVSPLANASCDLRSIRLVKQCWIKRLVVVVFRYRLHRLGGGANLLMPSHA
jgi:hypothetical protein